MSHLDRFIDFRLFVSSVKKTDKLIDNYARKIGNTNSDDEKTRQEQEVINRLFKIIEPGRPDLDKV